MNRLPKKFYPPFLMEPRTSLPPALRDWLGARLMGPRRGPRRHTRQACVLALGRIGDFVLSLSAFRLFAREFGADQLAIVLPPMMVPLAALELPGVELIPLQPEAGALFREILPVWRHDRPRLAVDRFERSITLNHYRPFYHEIVLSWIDAKAEFYLTPETYPPAVQDGQCRELQAHRMVASAALGRAVAWEEILPGFTQFPSRDDGRLYVYPLSQDGSKNIPAGRVAAILRLWRERSRAPIVFGGSPRDRSELEHYAVTAGVDGLTVETPAGIIAFIEHLAAAGAVLNAESASGHVAAAFDKPSVVLAPRAWHGLSQPWHKSGRQHTFLLDAPDAGIAAALPAL